MTLLRLEANPHTIALDGSAAITVTAIDPTGVPARSGPEILLSTSLGSLEERVETDSRGIARATLHGTGRAGTATVGASSGKVNATPVMVVIGPQALKANFTQVVGESLTVNFQDTSQGNPTSWAWDFGDGGTSTVPSPAHTYAAAGSYVVTLVVSNPDGQDSHSQRITVPASEAMPPQAKFSAAVNGLQVVFTDMSTNKVTRWDWQFGDGERSSLQNPTHLYRQAGIYSVTLTASNAAGSSTFSQSVTVPNSPAPTANFEARESDGREVLFRDTSTGGPTSWDWDFGDGQGSQEQNPTHRYAATGTYTVRLTVGNLVGRSSTTQFVTVRGRLVADFSCEKSGLTIRCTEKAQGMPATFEWDFGDATPKRTERNPVHTYERAGSYVVTLTVTRLVSGSTTLSERADFSQSITVP